MIEFTIPGLRLKSLNSREHWRVKAKRVKGERSAVIQFIPREALMAPFPSSVTITRIGPRRLDSDNAVGSAKHVRDQIAGCLGVDDGDPSITWIVNQEKGPFGVRVRIETKEEA